MLVVSYAAFLATTGTLAFLLLFTCICGLVFYVKPNCRSKGNVGGDAIGGVRVNSGTGGVRENAWVGGLGGGGAVVTPTNPLREVTQGDTSAIELTAVQKVEPYPAPAPSITVIEPEGKVQEWGVK